MLRSSEPYVDDGFRTFRVDRMTGVTILETNKRQGKDAFNDKDMVMFSKSTFNMFSGQEERVEMVFHNRMMDVVIDKFGKDVWLNKVDEWHFKISVPVAVSPQFFAWVFGLGNYVTITGPEHVKKQMKDMLEDVHKRYCEEEKER